MANIVAPRSVVSGERIRIPVVVGGKFERPLSTRTFKQITGHVRDVNNVAIQGATVELFRQRDNLFAARTTTDVSGAYVFSRRSDDVESYYTVAYSIAGGSVQVHGVSDRGLVPA